METLEAIRQKLSETETRAASADEELDSDQVVLA
jgi:hypothetical protein